MSVEEYKKKTSLQAQKMAGVLKRIFHAAKSEHTAQKKVYSRTAATQIFNKSSRY